MNEIQIINSLREINKTITYKQIAELTGINQSTIWRIANKRNTRGLLYSDALTLIDFIKSCQGADKKAA